MLLQDIESRISTIEETIKATVAQVQGYNQSLQESTQQLSTLKGHLQECQHWKMEFQNSQLGSEKERLDEQVIEQDKEQAPEV